MARKILGYAGLFAWALVAVATLCVAAGLGQDKKGGGPRHVFAGPAPVHPFDLILARPTANSVTASVLAYNEMEGYITYGTQKENLTVKTPVHPLPARTPVEFLLKGLQPDTRYYYRLHTRTPQASGFTADTEHTFHTQRKPGSTFTFTLQADSHLDQGTRPAVYERTLANALADRPDFHIDLGDTFMTDKYDKHTDALPQYLAQRYYFGRIAHSAPLFLVLGNHDGERLDRYDGSADCMPVWSCLTRKKYFPNPTPDSFYTGNPTPMKHLGRVENYYAWEWGDALFVVLDPFWNTNKRGRNRADGNWTRTLGKEQYDWLAKTLAGSKARVKFVFIHHLVGGLDESARGGSEAAALYEWGGKNLDGKDEFKLKRPGWPMPIHPLLVKHHVTAVFHGHDHFFAKQELDNVLYLMVPQPGHPGQDRLRNVEEYGYIRGHFLPPSGHVRVTVAPEKATIEYVRAYLPQVETAQRKNGQIAYSFSCKP